MPRSAWGSPVDEQAAGIEAMSRRIAALEGRLTRQEPGPWYYVGQTVRGIVGPAFTNTFANVSGHRQARFRMQAANKVRVECVMAASGNPATNGASAWTMPSAFRPDVVVQVKARTSPGAAGFEVVNFNPDGTVACYWTDATGTFVNATGAVVSIQTEYYLT